MDKKTIEKSFKLNDINIHPDNSKKDIKLKIIKPEEFIDSIIRYVALHIEYDNTNFSKIINEEWERFLRYAIYMYLQKYFRTSTFMDILKLRLILKIASCIQNMNDLFIDFIKSQSSDIYLTTNIDSIILKEHKYTVNNLYLNPLYDIELRDKLNF